MNKLIDKINVTKNIFGDEDEAYSLSEEERTRLYFDKFFEFQDINNLVAATLVEIENQKARIEKIGDKDDALKTKCNQHLEDLYFRLDSLRTQRDYVLYKASFLSHASFRDQAKSCFEENAESLGLDCDWLEPLRAFSWESVEGGVFMPPSGKDFVCARYAPEILLPPEMGYRSAILDRCDMVCFPESIQIPLVDKEGNSVPQLSDGRTRLNVVGFATMNVTEDIRASALVSCVSYSESPDRHSPGQQSDEEVLRSTWRSLRRNDLIPDDIHGLIEVAEIGMKFTEIHRVVDLVRGMHETWVNLFAKNMQ